MYLRRHRPTRLQNIILYTLTILALILCFSLGHYANQISHSSMMAQNQLAQNKTTRIIEKHWHHPLTNTNKLWVIMTVSPHHFKGLAQENADNIMNYLKSHKHQNSIKYINAPIDDRNSEHNLTSHDKTTQLVQLDVAKHKSLPNLINHLRHCLHTPYLKLYFTSHDSMQNALASQSFNLQISIISTAIIGSLILFWLLFHSFITAFIATASMIISTEIAKSIPLLLPWHIFNVNYFNLDVFLSILLIISLIYNVLFDSHMQSEIKYQTDDDSNLRLACENTKFQLRPYWWSLIIGSLLIPNGLSLSFSLLCLYLILPLLQSILNNYYPDFIPPRATKHQYLPKRITAILVLLICLIGVGYCGTHIHHTQTRFPYIATLQQGQHILHHHFSSQITNPTYIYLHSKYNINNKNQLQTIDKLTTSLRHNHHINSVFSFTQPTGKQISSLYLNNQLSLLSSQKMHDLNINNSKELKATLKQLTILDKNYQSFGLARLKSSNQSLYDQLNHQHNEIKRTQKDLKPDLKNFNDNHVQMKLNKLIKILRQTNHQLNQFETISASHKFYLPHNVFNSSLFSNNRKLYYSKNQHATVIKLGLKSNTPNSVIHKLPISIKHQLKNTNLKHCQIGIDSQKYQQIYSTHHVINHLWLLAGLISLIMTFILLFMLHSALPLFDLILSMISSVIGIFFLEPIYFGVSAMSLLIILLFNYLSDIQLNTLPLKRPVLWSFSIISLSLILTFQPMFQQLGYCILIGTIFSTIIRANINIVFH